MQTPEFLAVKKPPDKAVPELFVVKETPDKAIPEIFEVKETTDKAVPKLIELKKPTEVTVPELIEIKKPTEVAIPELIAIQPPTSSSLSDYDEIPLQDPDERKIQEVIKNFQQATEEDQLKHRTKKRKGKRILRRNEPFDGFRAVAWPQVHRGGNEDTIKTIRVGLSANDSDDQEPTDLSDDDDLVEERLDELQMNVVPENADQKHIFSRKLTDDEAVQNSVNKLQSVQTQGKKIPHGLPDVAEIINENAGDETEPEIEFIEENAPVSSRSDSKQSLRDMVEDLIAASLIAVFVILALIAMFYTVSFVRSKEKEKSPTITIIESGCPDGTRKYTVCPTKKTDASICHTKKFRPSRQRQTRPKLQKTISSNLSSECSNRSTETITLPPPRIIPTCPRPLRSSISRARSPRPLSPQPVCPCSRSSQLTPKSRTLIPSPHELPHKTAITPERRDSTLPAYQGSRLLSSPKVISSYDVGSAISEGNTMSDRQASRLRSTPRMMSSYDVGSVVSASDTMPDRQASRLLPSPRMMSPYDERSVISERDALPDHQASRLLSTSRMVSPYDVASTVSERDTAFPDYKASQILSTTQMVPSHDLAPSISAKEIHPGSVSDKGLVRSIHRDIVPAQLLSQSAPLLSTSSSMKQQTPSLYITDRSDATFQDDYSHYPSSILRTKSYSFMREPEEHQISHDPSNLERSSRSAYISDDGDVISVDYADPTSSTSRQITSSQYVVPQTPLSTLTSQTRQVTPSLPRAPMSVSFTHPPTKYQSSQSLAQRARAKSVNIPFVSPQADQYVYQGTISSGDLGQRAHYIPKRSVMSIQTPVISQPSVHPLIPFPQGLSEQSLAQSQFQTQSQYKSPTLSRQQLSDLSSQNLHEQSEMAYIPSSQQMSSGERSYRNIAQTYPVQFGPQRQTVSSPTLPLAYRSFVQQQAPSLSYGGLSPVSTRELSKVDTSLQSRDTPYPLAQVSRSPSIQGWISTDSPTVGEVSISNIPSRGDFASSLHDIRHSRVDSFDTSMAPSAAYSPIRQLSFFPSYQTVAPGSPQGSTTEAEYLRTQDTLQSSSPLPKVPPPPLSPSRHSQSMPQLVSSTARQQLSPLSLPLLHERPRPQIISTFPPGSLSPRPRDSFRSSAFEDSNFLKMSPISQSFIYRNYSIPSTPKSPVSQSFAFKPGEFSLGDDDVFTYPSESQPLVSTPRDSRTLSVSIDPEAFHTAVVSPSSISSQSTGGTCLRSFEDSFPTSSDSMYHGPPSPLVNDKYIGPSSDYSINEIGSDINLPHSSHYYTARNFFNDSSDHTNSD
ncbi:mucin-2-like isoform X4 [Stegostoma tigrinum]|uniref:mucin-2-like isoform X4 n=1 Tax=Stegostoma tigrinum TaxID=3053191 RepID=UPI00202B06F0|nr:mucin-2-like isoform X4 [Stegostoma tigrinum]